MNLIWTKSWLHFNRLWVFCFKYFFFEIQYKCSTLLFAMESLDIDIDIVERTVSSPQFSFSVCHASYMNGTLKFTVTIIIS